MKAEPRFQKQPKSFWANVRLISQKCGYTVRGQGQIKVPSLDEMAEALRGLNLGTEHLVQRDGTPTAVGQLLVNYFELRAARLNGEVEGNLMDAAEAKALFEKHRKALKPKCPVPMNKQKKAMRAPAYLTGLVNMMIEAHACEFGCNYDPLELTTIVQNGAPLRTLARRVDGCFPTTVNPIAVWEIKEYYYTTTFGSRIADAVYESLLDGMELEERRESENIDVKHYLMVDSHYTWWESGGRSYLCRIFDMLHMSYVDEVLFGKEVVSRLPELVSEWVELARQRGIEPRK